MGKQIEPIKVVAPFDKDIGVELVDPENKMYKSNNDRGIFVANEEIYDVSIVNLDVMVT